MILSAAKGGIQEKASRVFSLINESLSRSSSGKFNNEKQELH